MRYSLIGTMLMLGLCAFAQLPPTASLTGGDPTTEPAVDRGGSVLFSTLGDIIDVAPQAISSQNMTDAALSGYFTAAADDFTVPSNGWRIDEVEVRGTYLGTATDPSVNVYILGDSGGLPDTTNLSAGAIFAAENLSPAGLDTGDFIIDLGGVTLLAGTYWLVVQVNMPIGAGNQWIWTESADVADSGNVHGSESAWLQEAQGFFAGGACAGTWGSRLATCGVIGDTSGANNEGDMAFELRGEDYTPGVAVSPSSFETTEGLSTQQYGVQLTAPPEGGETVTVNVSSGDVTEGTVSPASLDFTAANWNIYQFVTVTPGAAGDGNDGNVAYTISNTASGNPASGYSSENADVSVTNNDVDGGKLIIVDPISGLSVDEEGSSSATFTVRLTENPSAGTVTVTVDSDANTQVSLDDATYQASVDVVMSDTTPVTVYVQGDSSDSIDEDDVPFTVTTNMAVVSDDVTYEQNPADVTGTVTDDDTAGFMVAGGPLSTTEAGGSDSFTISITSEPAPGTTVTVDFLSSNTDEADSPASVVFTPANWSDPAVIVTVNGVDDDVDDGDQPFTIQATVNNGGGTDPVYAALDPDDVEGTNTDDDTFGMTVSPTSGLTTAEADNSTTGSASFTVVLDSEPTFDVSVDAATDDATEGLIGTAMGGPFSENLSLTFTPANWDTPQTVWVAGVDDILRADGDIVYNISVDSSSDDPQYEGLSDSVEVTNLDDVGEECTEPVTLSYDGNSITIVGTPGCEYEIYEGGTAGVNDGTLVCSGIIPDSGVTSCVPGGGVQEDTLYQAFSPGGVLLSNGLVTVPTLGEWALIAFITMLMAAGVVMMRRRRLEF